MLKDISRNVTVNKIKIIALICKYGTEENSKACEYKVLGFESGQNLIFFCKQEIL